MEELIQMAKEEDKDAFTQAVLQIQKDLYVVAKSRLKKEDDICDAMQNTMLLGFQNIKKLKENCYFKTWMVRILINQCNNFYRKRERRDISFEEKNWEEYFGEAKVEANELEFEDLISCLKKDEKTIMTLYYVLQYTTKEISQIIGQKESTIRSKIARAKVKIKKNYLGG